MARNVFRNGASLYRVIEDAPLAHLSAFLLQEDDNFRPIHEMIRGVFAASADEEALRLQLKRELNQLPADRAEPVEVECQRILDLAEKKGPTSLRTLVERQLNNEDCNKFDEQPDDLAKSLWAHIHHRRIFDDAVSFKAIRSWRNAGRLFAAFNVDLDGKGSGFRSGKIDTDKLNAAIAKKLKTTRPLTISVIDLPQVAEYPASVLVIVRFAGQQTSAATHGDGGERRLIYYLPQDEAILIYTPADERIEVAATKATVRNAVAECFAVATLGQDVSKKPLTSAIYDTLRFLSSMELSLPEVPDFTVTSAKVIDIELRVENWQTKIGVSAAGNTKMAGLMERYLAPGRVLSRALGISRVMISVGYEIPGDDTQRILDIMISDRNSSSLNSERDPVIRNLGRKLLESWSILRPFRDLNQKEAIDALHVMAELWELNESEQKGSYFLDRRIEIKPLEVARLICRKEIEPKLIEEEDDPEVDEPTIADRTIYAIDLDWVKERLTSALKGIIDVAAVDDSHSGLTILGTTRIDDREVPCYLARGVDQMKSFALIDERLRARAGAGPGIVFTGKRVGPKLIGANVVVPLVSSNGGTLNIGSDREAVARAFRAGRSLALGAGTLELVEESGNLAARLHVPGGEPLDIFGEATVRAFRLLVEAAKRGAPGVRSGELIAGSGSSGFQQMIGRQWPVVSSYVESTEPRRWKLKGF